MPRYFFDTDDGERRNRDDTGLDLPDIEAAVSETFGLLRDLAHGMAPDGRRVLVTTVRDDRGRHVYRGEMTIEGQRSAP